MEERLERKLPGTERIAVFQNLVFFKMIIEFLNNDNETGIWVDQAEQSKEFVLPHLLRTMLAMQHGQWAQMLFRLNWHDLDRNLLRKMPEHD